MFCPKCGKKNVEGARFCEFCGAEIKNEEKVVLPKNPRKKMNKKHMIIIAVAIVLVLFVLVFGIVLSNNFKPSKVASEYFLALVDDSDKVYDFINIPKNEFTTKEVFEKVNKEDDSDLDVLNWEVVSEEISSDGLSAQVVISYTLEGRQTSLLTTIYLVKDSKNKFLIFDNWKISEGSSLVKENYEIKTYKGSTLKLEGIDVDKKYLKKSDDNYDIYVIPALFKGEYNMEVTLTNGLKASSKIEVDNSNFSFENFKLNDNDSDDLESVIISNLNKLYEYALDNKSFDDIKADYEYDGADLDDLEDSYNQFLRFIKASGLTKYEVSDVSIEKMTVTEKGYIYVTVVVDYDYAAKAYLSDEDIEKSDEDTCYLTFDYKDGFKLVDMSSLVTTFSRF